MHDLEGISFIQQGRTVRFTGNNIAIKLDHDTTGADLQFFKQASDVEPVRDFLFFSVDTNFHVNKKTVSTVTTQWWLGKTVSSSPRFALPSARGTVTFALPYAGAIRIRFEGLPDYSSGSQSASGRHP